MGSKKYKDATCVYCSLTKADVGDHIFARELFHPSQRANLPKAPSCNRCNSEKSRIEHYLTAVLPFGGRHVDANSTLTEFVPGRLKRNVRLHRRLAKEMGSVWNVENGIYRKSTTIPIEHKSLIMLFNYIAKGLAWHHWATYFTDEDEISVLLLTTLGRQFFEERFFSLRVAQRVQENLGNGTVRYEGVQGIDCAQITVWRFQLYGGLMFGGDPKVPSEYSTEIGVLTGPRELP